MLVRHAVQAEVRFERLDLALQVGEQCLGIDHEALLGLMDAPKPPGTTSCSASPGMTGTICAVEARRFVRVVHRAEQPQAMRRLTGLPGGHGEPGQQVGATRVAGQRGGVVQENDTVVRRHGRAPPCGSRSLLSRRAKPTLACGDASSESAASTDSHRGFPASLTISCSVRMNRAVTLTGLTPLSVAITGLTAAASLRATLTATKPPR